MKKALIIIGAVFAGLVVLVIVGGVIESNQQPIVVMQSPAPEAGQAAPGLTGDEQRVYDFIAVEFPKLRDMNDDLILTLEGDSYGTMLRELKRSSVAFLELTKRWNRLDWGYGAVSDLEDDFDLYMNNTRAFYRNWLKGISGENTTLCATNAVKAESKMNDLVPRIEGHLDELSDGTY